MVDLVQVQVVVIIIISIINIIIIVVVGVSINMIYLYGIVRNYVVGCDGSRWSNHYWRPVVVST
jgi:hypothetical protein